MVFDKAPFPRDKPCGDGLTPRAVSFIQKMGLAEQVAKFHRVNRATVYSPSRWELAFPNRPGMPDHGHVARRLELDTMLLDRAEFCGAEVRRSTEVSAPILDEHGRVSGVIVKSGERVLADAVIATDGAYSPIKRALRLSSRYNGYSAIAIRAEMTADRPDTDSLDVHLQLRFRGDQLPGYGWVFPLGGGRVNVGLGYVNSYKKWRQINATQLMGEFLTGLPAEWQLPGIDQLMKTKAVQAWRLPMGFTAWPPWRPGVLFAGDALGAARPASGAGISKALQSGLAAGECAIAALTNGGPDDLAGVGTPAFHADRGHFRARHRHFAFLRLQSHAVGGGRGKVPLQRTASFPRHLNRGTLFETHHSLPRTQVFRLNTEGESQQQRDEAKWPHYSAARTSSA